MAKTCHTDVIDQALNYIKSNANKMVACSAQPTTYTEAVTTYALASKVISSTDFTGPATGDVSGRKITVNAQAAVSVTATGNPTHIALVDTVNSKLLYVTEETGSGSLSVGGTGNFPAWDIEIGDPI